MGFAESRREVFLPLLLLALLLALLLLVPEDTDEAGEAEAAPPPPSAAAAMAAVAAAVLAALAAPPGPRQVNPCIAMVKLKAAWSWRWFPRLLFSGHTQALSSAQVTQSSMMRAPKLEATLPPLLLPLLLLFQLLLLLMPPLVALRCSKDDDDDDDDEKLQAENAPLQLCVLRASNWLRLQPHLDWKYANMLGWVKSVRARAVRSERAPPCPAAAATARSKKSTCTCFVRSTYQPTCNPQTPHKNMK